MSHALLRNAHTFHQQKYIWLIYMRIVKAAGAAELGRQGRQLPTQVSTEVVLHGEL